MAGGSPPWGWAGGPVCGRAVRRSIMCKPLHQLAPLAPILHAGCITQWIYPLAQHATPRLSGQVGPGPMSGGLRGSIKRSREHGTGKAAGLHAPCLVYCSHILMCSHPPLLISRMGEARRWTCVSQVRCLLQATSRHALANALPIPAPLPWSHCNPCMAW